MLYQHIRFGIDRLALLRDTQHEFSNVIRSDIFEPFPLHIGLDIAIDAALVIRPAAKGQIGAVKIHPPLGIVVEQWIVLVFCALFLLLIELEKLFRQLIGGSAIDCNIFAVDVLDPFAKEVQFFHIFIFGFLRSSHVIYLHVPFGRYLRMRGYKNNNRSCGGAEF